MALLQTSYDNRSKEIDQLQTSNTNLIKEKNQLETRCNKLTREKDQLQTSYNNLLEEKGQFQTRHNNLVRKKDQLQTSYNNLVREKDQLQTSYNNLVREKEQLQTSSTTALQLSGCFLVVLSQSNTRWPDLALPATCSTLAFHLCQLQLLLPDPGFPEPACPFTLVPPVTSPFAEDRRKKLREDNKGWKQIDIFLLLATAGLHVNMSEKMYDCDYYEDIRQRRSERKLYRLVAVRKRSRSPPLGYTDIFPQYDRYLLTGDLSQQGWVYFNNSFYYISTSKNSWNDSRSDCLQRGADLVVINSKAEQEFTRHFGQHIWIGLTDHEMEGKWKWVDGTPLTKSYWGTNEPNSYKGSDEDCGEIKFFAEENNWNDKPCHVKNVWICEKAVAP
ncbi:uncharacterized protein LOC110970752 [Acanthochromis polyacanthus]|uniref:uncharacterized protein LOC110970752 n=1 Tax=Acanthochromis polyacanthus TaxID=80966 RepID=UPI002234E876|nr:uncharacterized protein LOC110970752 [Acanthochromis polyacanthus]